MSTAKSYALSLLGYRAYTEKALYEKLCSRYDEQEAAEAISRMVELNLLDDTDYAKRLAANLVNIKAFAPRRAKHELELRGIDSAIAEEVLAEYDGNLQPAIAKLIKRKYNIDTEKGRLRAISGLTRRGYSRGDILTVLRRLDEDEDYYEEWEED